MENVVQGVAQIEFSVFGVVGDLHFEMLAEVEVEAFDDQYFEHRGQGFLLLIFRFYRMHSIYYNREPNSQAQNKTLLTTYTSPTTYLIISFGCRGIRPIDEKSALLSR